MSRAKTRGKRRATPRTIPRSVVTTTITDKLFGTHIDVDCLRVKPAGLLESP